MIGDVHKKKLQDYIYISHGADVRKTPETEKQRSEKDIRR